MFPVSTVHYKHLIHGPNRVSATIVSRFSQSGPTRGTDPQNPAERRGASSLSGGALSTRRSPAMVSGDVRLEPLPGRLPSGRPAAEGPAADQFGQQFRQPVAGDLLVRAAEQCIGVGSLCRGTTQSSPARSARRLPPHRRRRPAAPAPGPGVPSGPSPAAGAPAPAGPRRSRERPAVPGGHSRPPPSRPRHCPPSLLARCLLRPLPFPPAAPSPGAPAAGREAFQRRQWHRWPRRSLGGSRGSRPVRDPVSRRRTRRSPRPRAQRPPARQPPSPAPRRATTGRTGTHAGSR